MLIKLFFIISIFFTIVVINLFNYFYVGLSYYDFGLYFNKVYNLSYHPEILTFGHFQPIIYLIQFFYNIFDIYGIFILIYLFI